MENEGTAGLMNKRVVGLHNQVLGTDQMGWLHVSWLVGRKRTDLELTPNHCLEGHKYLVNIRRKVRSVWVAMFTAMQ